MHVMLVLQVVNLANMNKRDTTSAVHLLSLRTKKTCPTINQKQLLIYSRASDTGGRTILSLISPTIRSWWVLVWATLKPQELLKPLVMAKYFIKIIMDNSSHWKMLHSKPETTSKARRCNNRKGTTYFQIHKKWTEVVCLYHRTTTRMNRNNISQSIKTATNFISN